MVPTETHIFPNLLLISTEKIFRRNQ